MEIIEQRDEMETNSSLLSYSASSCTTELIETEGSSLNILLEKIKEGGEEAERRGLVSVVVRTEVGGAPGCVPRPRDLFLPCESNILRLSPDRPIFLRRNLRGRSFPMVEFAEKIKKMILEAGPEVLIPGSSGIIRVGVKGEELSGHPLETILEEPLQLDGQLMPFCSMKQRRRTRDRRDQCKRALRRMVTDAKVTDISKQFLNMGL